MSISILISSHYNIPFSELNLEKKIGAGGFGTVYRGTWGTNTVAIKVFKEKREALKEIRIMSDLRFPQIVNFLGISLENASYCMVLEYMSKGSLSHVLYDPQEILPWPIRLKIAIDIGIGLAYLDERFVRHCDLKSSNVLIDNAYNAKISDFGLSKLEAQSSNTAPVCKRIGGSIRWRAPELFADAPINTSASDVYSYGMVLWQIISRKTPFKNAINKDDIRLEIIQGKRDEIPPGYPAFYTDILQRCWAQNARERLRAVEVVQLLQDQKSPASDKHEKFLDLHSLVATLPMHAQSASDLMEQEDGTLASVSRDKVHFWDRQGHFLSGLNGSPGRTKFLIVLKDGIVASKNISDNIIKLWNRKGQCLATLQQQDKNIIHTFMELNDGTLATISYGTINLWDRQGNCLASLEGDRLIELKNGTLATRSGKCIKLWDRQGNCLVKCVHEKNVHIFIELADGTLASSSYDDTIKLWDRQGDCLISFKGPKMMALNLIELKDGILATTSSLGHFIQLWNKQGKCLVTFPRQTARINLTELKNGLIASISRDNNIKFWDRQGNCLTTTIGLDLKELKDGTLAILALDGTFQLWTLSSLGRQ